LTSPPIEGEVKLNETRGRLRHIAPRRASMAAARRAPVVRR